MAGDSWFSELKDTRGFVALVVKETAFTLACLNAYPRQDQVVEYVAGFTVDLRKLRTCANVCNLSCFHGVNLLREETMETTIYFLSKLSSAIGKWSSEKKTIARKLAKFALRKKLDSMANEIHKQVDVIYNAVQSYLSWVRSDDSVRALASAKPKVFPPPSLPERPSSPARRCRAPSNLHFARDEPETRTSPVTTCRSPPPLPQFPGAVPAPPGLRPSSPVLSASSTMIPMRTVMRKNSSLRSGQSPASSPSVRRRDNTSKHGTHPITISHRTTPLDLEDEDGDYISMASALHFIQQQRVTSGKHEDTNLPRDSPAADLEYKDTDLDSVDELDRELDSLRLSLEVNPVSEITDPLAIELWSSLGKTAFVVDFDSFYSEYSARLHEPESAETKELLQQVLTTDLLTVTATKFTDFLKGFGPFPESLNNLRQLTTQPWFHGFLSRDESERSLAGEPPGTFLVRFSSMSVGSFALDVVGHSRAVAHTRIISNHPEPGVSVREQHPDGTIDVVSFGSLCDALASYKRRGHLTIPCSHSYLDAPWFHGDLSANEAAEILSGEPAGTFLIRFSTSPGSFSSSLVADRGTVHHSRFQKTPKGSLIESGSGREWDDLATMVLSNSYALRFPCNNIQGRLNAAARASFVSKNPNRLEDTYCAINALDHTTGVSGAHRV